MYQDFIIDEMVSRLRHEDKKMTSNRLETCADHIFLHSRTPLRAFIFFFQKNDIASCDPHGLSMVLLTDVEVFLKGSPYTAPGHVGHDYASTANV